MKHNSFILTCLFAIFMTMPVLADNPAGYTIFGPNKYGYEDLTSKVQYSTNATFNSESINGGDYASVPAAGSILAFTGTGHSSHYCQKIAALSIRFSESVTMTLTDKYAIHMKIKRTNAGTGDIQSSFIKGTWSSVRVGFLWTGVTDVEKEIVLKFSDKTPNVGGYYSNNENNTYSTQTFAGGNWNELFRMTALSGESFEISQIYIKADETQTDPVDPSGDKDAPTNLQASVKAGSVKDVSAVITASAEDENAITFNVYNGENVIATATSTSGVAKDIEVTGLTPNTAYSLYVEAVDAVNNVNPTKQSVTFKTFSTDQMEKRYYFFRTGDLPAMDGMTAVDLREGVGTTIGLNGMIKGSATDYVAYTLNSTWFSFNQNLKASTNMSDVNQDSWTLVVKMRTSVTHNSFNIRLNNAGECYQVSKGNLTVSSEWQVLKLALADSKKTLSFSSNMNGTIFQMHSDVVTSGQYLDIEYAYLTNVPTNPEKPIIIDNDPPTDFNAEVKSGSVKAVEATVTVSAKDANSPITFKFYDTEEGTTPVYTTTSNSDVAKDYTITGLTPETPYTFYVEAVDPSGNVTTRQTVTFTTLEQLEKRYYFVRSGDLPVVEKMTAVDLRATTYSTWSGDQIGAPDMEGQYAAWTLPNSWFAAVLKPKAQCMSDVTKADWYLRMKFKTDAKELSNQNLRINLSDGAKNFFMDNSYGDGEWHDTVYALANAAGTLRSFPVNANEIMFQLHANSSLNGSYFYIEYAYLTNVPTNPEKPIIEDNDPPTDVSIAVKDGTLSYDRLTLQLYAEDEDTPITYAVKYQVKNSGDTWTEVPAFTGAQGTTIEKEITGLTPNTTYTFSVVASDPNGNAADPKTAEATTTKLAEKRYYFFRTGDLPANTDDLTCVDLRKGQGSTINFAQGGTAISEITGTLFSKYKLSSAWCFVRVMPYAQTMDDVDGSWYLHIRYKSTHPQDVYANVAGHDKKSIKIATSADADNEWKVVNISLADYASKMTIPVAANTDAFQIQAPNNATPGTFAIDYAYVSNSETSVDAGYVDGTAPVVTVEEKATTATTVTLTISGTDDSDSKIVYTFSDGANPEEVTKNSGETFDYTFENLTKGTEYTFTVDAKDLSNNEMTQISKTITTPGGETKPVIQKFAAEVTPTTITLTFNATDEDTEHPLTYNISDGTNNYQVQETQGVDVVYTLKGLTPDTEYNLTLTATNASENTSDPSEKNVTTTYLKPSEFGVKIATVDMYNLNGHIAGNEKKSSIEYRVVTYKNYLLFQHKIVKEGHGVSTDTWDNQMWVGESPLNDGQRDDYAAQYNPFGTQIRLTEKQIPFKQHTGSVEFDFDMYARIFGVTGATCSQMQHFVCGYINTPSEDTEAPSIFSVNYEDKDGNRYLTIDANDNNNTTKDVFYYVKEGDNEYISLQTVVVPLKSDVTYECYAVDWNGNKSEKYEVHISAATIQLVDSVDNTSTINSWNDKLVNAKLTRTLSSAYYNTLCLPFGVEADQIVTVMGEGTKIAQLETARIKDNDELYLGFSFTDHIEAGVPYFVQPAQNVENPTFVDVTINRNLQPTVIDGVITFQGIYNPTPLQAETEESHTILMLVANNQLTFPNEAGTMKSMRAYFKTSGAVAHIARRASFEVSERQMPTGEMRIENGEMRMNGKYIMNGRFVIVKENKMYNAVGQRVGY